MLYLAEKFWLLRMFPDMKNFIYGLLISIVRTYRHSFFFIALGMCNCTLQCRLALGRGHTNYDIQIIVVILKVITIFFQLRPWIIERIIMIFLGSHMPNMNYKVIVCSTLVELPQ